MKVFIKFLHERDPDILVAHAIMWADLPHLMRRLKDPDQLSPLGQVIRPFKGRDGYKDTQQPIKGRLCWDSLLTGRVVALNRYGKSQTWNYLTAS